MYTKNERLHNLYNLHWLGNGFIYNRIPTGVLLF